MHSCVRWTAELFYDRGNHYKFTSLVRELDTANVLMGNRVSCDTPLDNRDTPFTVQKE
jgi:hypothetical protein